MGFTTSADIIGPGLCRSFWTYNHGVWVKHLNPCHSHLIFDKFSPTSIKSKTNRQLLFSDPLVKPFNDPILYDLFFDKQLTYNQLSQYSIPTIPLQSLSPQHVSDSCASLSQLKKLHSQTSDFSTDIIMKDRFGAGGRHVHKFKANQSLEMYQLAKRHPRVSFIIQPFTKFDKGFSYQDIPASTDIRLIYLKGKIIQSYIRSAKANEFRCNEHQGGLLTYLSLSQIPDHLVKKSNQIAKELNCANSLFTLDFIISNRGNSYLLEGNTGPGLDWNMSIEKNEIEAKKLIRLVANELNSRHQKTRPSA